MAHQGGVAPAAAAQAAYQQGVQGKGATNWSAGCQAYVAQGGQTPMAKAAARAGAAVTAYSQVVGSAGWASMMASMPMSAWSGPTVSGGTGAQKYAMAKGAKKWGVWYAQTGQQMAMAMRQYGIQARSEGVPWQQRVVLALDIAQQYSKKVIG